MHRRQDHRSHRVVQAIWVGMMVLAIALFVASLPAHYRQLQTLAHLEVDDAASVRLGLAELGLSTSSHAGSIVAIKGLLGFGFAAIAILIALNKLNDPFAIFVSMTLILFGSTFSDTLPALVAEQPVWDIPVRLLSMVGFVCFVSLFFLFPDGQFVPGWTIYLIPLWIAEEWVHFFPFDNPLVDTSFFVLFLGLLAAGLGAQVYRYRRVSTAVERQQTKWIVYGLVTSVVAFLIYGLTSELFTNGKGYVLHQLIAGSLMSAAFLLLPLAIANAILRHRLWGIDRLVSRTLVFGFLSAAGVAIFLAVLASVGVLFGSPDSPIIGAIAVGIAAVTMQPLHRRVQRGVNRFLYGERDDPYAVLSRLGARLEETRTADTLPVMIVETIADSLKLPYVALALEQGDHMSIVASAGTEQPEVVVLPLAHNGERVGELRVAPRAPGEGFDRSDQRLLADIARQSGLAAHTYQLHAMTQQLATDLQRSRERLVTFREEERRRLRRDLHDGLGPRLAGFALQLDAIRNVQRLHPDRADALIGDLSSETRSMMADIRRLAYSLRPPALDDLGLIGALQQCVMMYDCDESRMSLRAPRELPPLPAAVEVAIFHIVREAVINVSRHAGPCSCQVHVDVLPDGTAMCCDVRDDGRGFPSPHPAGIGQMSMRERAAELNGTLSITSTPGVGTHIHARIPCALIPPASSQVEPAVLTDHLPAVSIESE